jgi:ribosomal protein S3
MEKNIIIKEIDRYFSKKHKNKQISEYLIYVTLEDGQKISAYTEIGEEAKKIRVNELLIEHFYQNNNLNVDIVSIEEQSVFKN